MEEKEFLCSIEEEVEKRYPLGTTPPMPASACAYHNAAQIKLRETFKEAAKWGYEQSSAHSKETKYYFIDFAIHPDLKDISPEEIKGFVKDGKATENWIFMQINGTIKYTFGKYGMPCPKYVFINRNYKRIGEMTLTLVRNDVKTLEEALFWNTQKIFVQEELNRQAKFNSEFNSDEDGLKFEFVII